MPHGPGSRCHPGGGIGPNARISSLAAPGTDQGRADKGTEGGGLQTKRERELVGSRPFTEHVVLEQLGERGARRRDRDAARELQLDLVVLELRAGGREGPRRVVRRAAARFPAAACPARRRPRQPRGEAEQVPQRDRGAWVGRVGRPVAEVAAGQVVELEVPIGHRPKHRHTGDPLGSAVDQPARPARHRPLCVLEDGPAAVTDGHPHIPGQRVGLDRSHHGVPARPPLPRHDGGGGVYMETVMCAAASCECDTTCGQQQHGDVDTRRCCSPWPHGAGHDYAVSCPFPVFNFGSDSSVTHHLSSSTRPVYGKGEVRSWNPPVPAASHTQPARLPQPCSHAARSPACLAHTTNPA